MPRFAWKKQGETVQYQSLDKPVQFEDCDDSQEFLLGTQSQCTQRLNVRSKQAWKLSFLTFINIAICLVTISVAGLGYTFKFSIKNNTKNSLLKMVDAYSPVHDQVQIDFVDVTINGSLLNIHDSIYRAPPSSEVDQAWRRISDLMPHVISSEEVVKLGKDPSKAARLPEDWGFGPNAHIVEVDIMHTIHCLNAIRRDIHWRYYFKDDYPDGNFPELHRVHTDHCIYIVLQNLMCSATVDLITQPWVDGQLHPFPDFNVQKKCRNFDAIVDWHEENRLTGSSRLSKMRVPEGVKPYRMSSEFHRMFGTGFEEALHGGHHDSDHEDHA